MLNEKIERRQLQPGEYGLFARESLEAGEWVWSEDEGAEVGLSFLSPAQVMALPAQERQTFLHFCHQVDRDLLSGHTVMEEILKDDAFFMNHSCDPNCWWQGEELVARRTIAPGEEITYDYGTDFTAFDRPFACRCGSALCRGSLRVDDWKLLKDRYGAEHLALYIQREFC